MTNANPPAVDQNLISRVVGILFKPRYEWPIIAAEQMTVNAIYTRYAMILAAIPALSSLIYNIASAHHTVVGALVIFVVGYALTLFSVYIVANVIEGLAHNFRSERNVRQSHKLAVYAMTPAWIAGILNIVGLDPFASLIGIYGFVLMYMGLEPLKQTPPDKRLMYTLSIVIVALLVNAGIWALMGAVMTSFAIEGAGPAAFALS